MPAGREQSVGRRRGKLQGNKEAVGIPKVPRYTEKSISLGCDCGCSMIFSNSSGNFGSAFSHSSSSASTTTLFDQYSYQTSLGEAYKNVSPISRPVTPISSLSVDSSDAGALSFELKDYLEVLKKAPPRMAPDLELRNAGGMDLCDFLSDEIEELHVPNDISADRAVESPARIEIKEETTVRRNSTSFGADRNVSECGTEPTTSCKRLELELNRSETPPIDDLWPLTHSQGASAHVDGDIERHGTQRPQSNPPEDITTSLNDVVSLSTPLDSIKTSVEHEGISTYELQLTRDASEGSRFSPKRESRSSSRGAAHSPEEGNIVGNEQSTTRRKLATLAVDTSGWSDGEECPSGSSSDLAFDFDIFSVRSGANTAVVEQMVSHMEAHMLQDVMDHFFATIDNSSPVSCGNPGNGGSNNRSGATSSLALSRASSRSFGGSNFSNASNNSPAGDDDDEHANKNRRRIPQSRLGQRKLRFACPFFKHNPERYQLRSCRGPGWQDVSRVKEHVKKVHQQPIFCPRCISTFKTKDELTVHLRADTVCERKTSIVPEGATEEQCNMLHKLKRPNHSQQDEWRAIYRILFALDESALVPSPYHDHHADAIPPDSNAADTEALDREDISRRVRDTFDRKMKEHGLTDAAKTLGMNAVRECIEGLHSYDRGQSQRQESRGSVGLCYGFDEAFRTGTSQQAAAEWGASPQRGNTPSLAWRAVPEILEVQDPSLDKIPQLPSASDYPLAKAAEQTDCTLEQSQHPGRINQSSDRQFDFMEDLMDFSGCEVPGQLDTTLTAEQLLPSPYPPGSLLNTTLPKSAIQSYQDATDVTCLPNGEINNGMPFWDPAGLAHYENVVQQQSFHPPMALTEGYWLAFRGFENPSFRRRVD